jgi:acyl-coenzyme A synthetase/AMP-(fatty) acid ligase
MTSFGWHAYAADAVIFVDPTGAAALTRTAAQLGGYARAIALHLEAGTPVVIACGDRYAFAAALLAAWSKNCAVHLPPNVRPETVTGLRADTGASAILHDRADAPEGLDVRGFEPAAGEAGTAHLPLPSDSEAAVVVYTSGSQGRPTPHRKTPAQLLGEAASNAEAFALGGATILASVPCHHIYGLLFGLLSPLLAGGRIVRATPLFPDEVTRIVEATAAAVWVAVPPHLQAFADTTPAPLARLRRVFSSGAPLPAAVAATLTDAGVAVTQVFGSTETGGIAARDGTAVTWQPLPGVTIGADEGGLLRVDSPWVVDPALRATRAPVTTADRVRLVEGGFVHEGRADGVVKVGGRRVDLGEIEARLAGIAGVRQARVIAQPGAGAHGTEILAVVQSADATLTPAVLRAELARWLDPLALPRRIRVVDQLPLGPAGKVAREALLALFDAAAEWTIAPRPVSDGVWSFTPSAQLGYFRGHFEQHPVLPAVVQLQRLALALARGRWPELGALTGLSRVKFRKLVAPGEEVLVALERPRGDLVKFVMTAQGQPVSSGNMTFANGFADTSANVGAPA